MNTFSKFFKKQNAIFLVFIFTFLIFGFSPNNAKAVVSQTPNDNTYITNGSVRSSVVGPDGTVYIGGAFTSV